MSHGKKTKTNKQMIHEMEVKLKYIDYEITKLKVVAVIALSTAILSTIFNYIN